MTDAAGLSAGDLLRVQGWNAKALKAVQDGAPGEALPFLEEALSVCRDAKILGNYGDALARCGRLVDAERAFLDSIEALPEYDQSYYNLGVVYERQDRLEEAQKMYEQAVARRATGAALNNLGNVYTRLLKLKDAEKSYKRAIKVGWTDARWNLALCQMMQGNWSEGWNNYENRPQMKDMAAHPQLWHGEDLRGKTIFVIHEQGLGDSIFAMRYYPVLKEMGARVLVCCEPSMMQLVKTMECVSEVYERSVYLPNVPFDYCVLALSLPGYLSPDGVGPNTPYLNVAGVKSPEFDIGLCWNGSTIVGAPGERNIPLKLLKPLSEIPGVRLISLQKGNAESEMDDCGFQIYNPMRYVKNVYDTAQIIASLDLVITIDTLIPHLAGALGKPTWLMNRWASCWQWGGDKDPHLYSTVTQIRQREKGKWDDVVEAVVAGVEAISEGMFKDERFFPKESDHK